MKFNKSAESDYFWYVGDEHGYHYGKIIKSKLGLGYCFEQSNLSNPLTEKHLEKILTKVKELNRESGIDTTSTFKSNSQ